MELDFDKEIDALIRREGKARTITIGEFAGLHPDADEIAAFVENAVPINARQGLITHFAGCDPCRRILSNTIEVNAEIASRAPDSIDAPETSQTAIPWYKRLFNFPQLAYVMGGLIVLFGGFIGFTVLNNYQNNASEISQMRSDESPAPAAPEAPGANTAAAVNAADTSSAAANAVTNSTVVDDAPPTSAANTSANTHALSKDQNFVADGVSNQSQAPAAAEAPPKTDAKPAERSNEPADDKKAGMTGEKEKKREEQAVTARSAPAPAPSNAPMKMKSPARNDQRDARETEVDLSQRRVDELPVAGRASTETNRKQVSGKTFEFRQGAWYDTTYKGQGTITVRRNTEDYRKLDSGLRGIAESFLGTVVTIWNGKAYRIQ